MTLQISMHVPTRSLSWKLPMGWMSFSPIKKEKYFSSKINLTLENLCRCDHLEASKESSN
jgi:hypothetical protein